MSKPLPLRRDTARRGAFTLLEVVIALAIFVFGALAIVRIFPPALGVIQNSGDQLVAVNFNRTTLARFTKTPEIVPDGLYDTSAEAATANWRNALTGSVAGTARLNNSIPVSNIQDYEQSALGHFKNLTGERHTIPADGMVLTQFPFETGSLSIYSEDKLVGVILKSDGSLDFTQAHRESDNSAFTPDVSSATIKDRVYVSYSFVESKRLSSVTDEPLDYSNTAPSPKIVQVARTEFSSSPQTVVPIFGSVTARVRSKSTAAPVIDGNLGRLDFDVATNPPGQKFSFDYKVRDWRWLVQDGTPTITPETGTGTGTNPRVVNLAVRPLDDTASPYVYTLLRSTGTPPSALPTPTPVTSDSNSSTLTNGNLNKKAGQVILDISGFPAPASRIVYRSLDNWAQQLSVAPPTYKLVYKNPTIEDWRDCAVENSALATNHFIYFKPSEAGKTILVSYSYENPAVAAGSRNASNDIRISSRLIPIDKDIIDNSTGLNLPSNFAVGGRVARAELTDVNGNPLAATLTSIREIKGASVQARTAWLNGDRFTQTSSETFRGATN